MWARVQTQGQSIFFSLHQSLYVPVPWALSSLALMSDHATRSKYEAQMMILTVMMKS
jgi:hypothetical protein